MNFLDLILVIVLSLAVFLGGLFLITPFFSKIPVVATRKKVLKEIISAMGLKEGSVLYDLGCGDGRVLFVVSKACQGVSCIGIERAPFLFLLAKVRQLFSRSKKASIFYGDMFKKDFSPATHIFLYLFPELMDVLMPKFEKELVPGTRIFSSDFQFSNRKPNIVLDLKSKNYQLNRKLYVYDF